MATRTFEEIERQWQEINRTADTEAYAQLASELEPLTEPAPTTLRLLILADIEGLSGRYDAALSKLQEALALYTEANDTNGIASVTGRIGSVYWRQGNYNEALDILQRALAMTTDDEFKERRATLTSNIAIIFTEMADYSTGLEYQQRALALYQELDLKEGQARTMTNIGIIYGEIDDHEMALEYMHRALAVLTEIGHDAGRANVMGNIGVQHAELDDNEEATKWLTQAIDLARTCGLSREQGFYLCNLANTASKSGDLDRAIQILDDNDAVIQENPTPRSSALVIRGQVAAQRKDYDDAIALISTALKQVEERGERGYMANYHEMLRDIAKDAGDFEGYIQHNEAYQQITEEIKGAASTRRLTMQEKEREIEEERREREKEREVLYGALPQHVADRLVHGEDVTDNFESASVMFLDIAGFTRIASTIPPGHVVHLLESIFSVCDEIVQKHGLTKVKTIGDSYMAVAGVPDFQDDHVDRMARASTEIQEALTRLQLKMPPELGDTSWVDNIKEVHARVGVHCGPVVAGVVGKERLQYDVWGDAVNVASRMESSGEPGLVQASEDFIKTLSEPDEWKAEPRIAFEIKGKGMMQTYWLHQRS